MPYIKVKPSSLLDASEDIERIRDKVDRIEDKFMAAYRQIDWEVVNKAEVSGKTARISQSLERQVSALASMESFLDNAYYKYIEVSGMEIEDRTPKVSKDTTSYETTKKTKTDDFFKGVKDGWKDFTDKVEDTAENIKEGVEDTVDHIKEGFEDAVDYVIDGTIKVSKEVYDWISKVAEKYKVPLKTAYQLYSVFKSYKIPVGALSLLDGAFNVFGFSNVVLYILDNYPSNEDHFNRNEHMKGREIPRTEEEAKTMGWNDGVAANCHQFSAPNKDNRKWVSPDGTCEVIFDKDGDVVTDTRDYGTYNYADPDNDPLGHLVKDVLPWIVNGNTPGENTTWQERMAIMMNKG